MGLCAGSATLGMSTTNSVRKFLVCIACLAILKILEGWLVVFPRSQDKLCTQKHIKEPIVSHPRCDACRVSALLLDTVLREADALVEPGGEELHHKEVEDIVTSVCHPSSFEHADLVEWEGNTRLAHPHLETWDMRGTPSIQMMGLNWAGRISDHCYYLMGHTRMSAAELYDLWLRTGYRHPREWVEFLCEGEGVFGDCLEDLPIHIWPGSGSIKPSSGPIQFSEDF